MFLLRSDAFAAFRLRDFSLLSINQLCLVLALVMQEIAISYALYQITQDPLSLGLIAVAELIPFIGFSFMSGHWADHYNRQKILQCSFCCSCAIPLLFIILFKSYEEQQITQNLLLIGIYFLIFCLGVIRGIYSPTFNSLRPFLIPTHAQANAATWTSGIWQFGAITAPLCAGLLLSQFGLKFTLMVVFIFCCLGSVSLFHLSKRTFPTTFETKLHRSLKEALYFMLQQRVLFWSLLLDLIAALFCSVVILLPIITQDVLQLGAESLSLLRAAPALGSCIMIFILLHFSPAQNALRNMLLITTGIATLTLVFALSKLLWLSFILLIFIGAFDCIGMVIRQHLLQQLPPKQLLGRVAALNGILVTSGNQLGGLQSSITTRYLSITPALLIGASICLSLCFISYFLTRNLLKTSLNHEKYTILTTEK